MQRIIRIENGITRMPAWRMAVPVNFELNDGENIAIVGRNASGKSMFVDIITNRHPLILKDPEYDFAPSKKTLISDNIKYITFKDSYGESDGAYYLQQRWNHHDIDEETPTAGELLDQAYCLMGEDSEERRRLKAHLYDLFQVGHLLDKYIIFLSSGELRKFQLIKMLFADPRVLIIDNPFIGLDTETRDQLRNLLAVLSRERTLQVIIVLAKSDEIPDFITHVVEVENMVVKPKVTVQEYLANRKPYPEHLLSPEKRKAIIDIPYKDVEYHSDEVVKMNNTTIRYGQRTIIKDLNWTVRNGERWVLSGQNGAGKSTLLSLVCADNPQGYACDIELFGIPRGSGESIWDIKKHIGYVSPEMHRAYRYDLPAIRIVASGLKDSVGLYAKPDVAEYQKCRYWMDIFGIAELEERPFLKLSDGEQRLVLLARAFVKDPELLILDEPFHGLDVHNRLFVTDIIETFCQRRNKTMIFVSHYMDELPKCIDHSITLQRIV
ncbi:MAG: ATP-binding cassette domain-containing protein [Prevotella sp.]|nr:ATP-binding cassette domain-containing protein [Prevotella sp.]